MPIYLALQETPDLVSLAVDRDEAGAPRELSFAPADPAAREAALAELAPLLGAEPVIVHGAARFGELLGARLLRSLARRWRDTLELALLADPSAPSHGQAALAARYGLEPADPGSAAAAAQLLRRLAAELARRGGDLSPVLRAYLEPLAGPDIWPGWALPPAVTPTPSALALCQLLARRPKRVDPVPEPLAEDLTALTTALLEPGGMVAQCHAGYEHRPGQVAMAAEVAETLQGERMLLVEAGTGVGKSLAYLVPAVLWARSRGRRVVISTNTKNLQDQLMDHDLPLVAQVAPLSFRAALLKGRANYLCLRQLFVLLSDLTGSLFRTERLAGAFLLAWVMASPTGDLERISAAAYAAIAGLAAAVPRVRAEGWSCAGPDCSYREVCRVEVARAVAANADVIVVNHALALNDAAERLLPPYDRLVLDEAHNLEDVATEALAREVSVLSLQGLVRALQGESGTAGVLGQVETRLGALELGEGGEALGLALDRLRQQVLDAQDLGEDLGEAVLAFAHAWPERGGGAEAPRTTVRLTPPTRASQEWAAVPGRAAALHRALAHLVEGLQALATLIAGTEAVDDTLSETLAADLAPAQQLAQEAAANLALTTGDDPPEGLVVWAEVWPQRRGGEGWALRAAPVEVGAQLDEALFSTSKSMVLTSATLTVEKSFAYVRRRLSLSEEQRPITELRVRSPFVLTEQLLLCVPSDLPVPGERGFAAASHEAIRELVRLSQGGGLALFTSRHSMLQAFAALGPALAEEGIEVLCQEESGPRSALLEALRAAGRPTLLLGLKSFWEGVDVPGEALRCLIIVKLPFAVPSDPLIEARCEHLERQGLNSHHHYYVPQAIISFKQGFGRLIRTRTDRGVVVVLDGRLLVRAYGQRFFRSLQRCALVREPWANCLRAAEDWFAGRSQAP